jgi:hypothetical protein
MAVGRALETLAAAAGCVLLGAASPVPVAAPPWMREQAMREAFIGRTLDGHYGNGLAWTEAYLADGRLEYREGKRQAAGRWHFRDAHVFCTFYDPAQRPALSGGCWNTLKVSANCFEFYLAGSSLQGEEADLGGLLLRWNARAWRRDAPSTCHEKPSV